MHSEETTFEEFYNGESSNRPYFSQFSLARFSYTRHDSVICRMVVEMVPCCNEPVYDINGKQIGKVGEILGAIPYVYFSILLENPFNINQFGYHSQFIMNCRNLIPIERFAQVEYIQNLFKTLNKINE